MKKILIAVAVFWAVTFSTKAQIHVDSVRIVSLGDSVYGLGLYNVVMPSGPCTIKDSTKLVGQDSIKVALCYMYGNSASQICHGYDTIVLGNIGNVFHTVVVSLSAIDVSTNTCANPNKKDTVVLQHIPTDIIYIESDHTLQLFPNPAGNILSGKLAGYIGATNLQITSAEGHLLLQNTITQANFAIDISALPPGLYFLQLTNGRLRIIRRFVKQ
ncbi:MAG: hypothetical protein RLZZ367_478 [Bacteroidota bacterium]|jgi:hypothetical protein